MACVAVALIVIASAQAVNRHVAYGRPGKVQLLRMEGYHSTAQKPQVVFPTHWIRRSPLARSKRQRICSTLQIWTQVGSPPKWKVAASSPTSCGWIVPGNYASVGKWVWDGATGTPYHAEFVVTWAIRGRRLAKATYDFNSEDDYHCLTTSCFITTDQPNNFAYIAFNP